MRALRMKLGMTTAMGKMNPHEIATRLSKAAAIASVLHPFISADEVDQIGPEHMEALRLAAGVASVPSAATMRTVKDIMRRMEASVMTPEEMRRRLARLPE